MLHLGHNVFHDIARLPGQSDLSDGYARSQFQSAGVNKRENASIPFYVAVQTIARRPRHIRDDRHALADHTIKKCGFADVRSAHDCNKWLHVLPSTLSYARSYKTIGDYYNIKSRPLHPYCRLSLVFLFLWPLVRLYGIVAPVIIGSFVSFKLNKLGLRGYYFLCASLGTLLKLACTAYLLVLLILLCS